MPFCTHLKYSPKGFIYQTLVLCHIPCLSAALRMYIVHLIKHPWPMTIVAHNKCYIYILSAFQMSLATTMSATLVKAPVLSYTHTQHTWHSKLHKKSSMIESRHKSVCSDNIHGHHSYIGNKRTWQWKCMLHLYLWYQPLPPLHDSNALTQYKCSNQFGL